MRQISLLIKAAMEGMMVCLEHCRRLIDHLATALCECVCECVFECKCACLRESTCVINVLTKAVRD